MTTMTLIKVAMMRHDGYPEGVKAPVYLKCPCGAKPDTNLDTQENVTCSCGRVFTYRGYIVNA